MFHFFLKEKFRSVATNFCGFFGLKKWIKKEINFFLEKLPTL